MCPHDPAPSRTNINKFRMLHFFRSSLVSTSRSLVTEDGEDRKVSERLSLELKSMQRKL